MKTQHETITHDGRKSFIRECRKLGYRAQFSGHGAGRRSVQVFDKDGNLIRDFGIGDEPLTVADLKLEST